MSHRPPHRAAPAPRPDAEALRAAAGRTVEDVIAPGLTLLFCGINPGLYTAWSGHHFARPGNRFWPALFAAGITPRLFAPSEEHELLALGCGITNLVPRASAAASELGTDEIRAGAERLRAKVLHYRPRVLALLGVTVYRVAFGRPRAVLGPQPETIGDTRLWVLPNPSGLNAHHRPADFARLFAEVWQAAQERTP